MKKKSKIFLLAEKMFNMRIFKYFFIGGLATITDWAIFYVLANMLSLHYLIALLISYPLGLAVHYTLNKKHTFKSTSKKITAQIFVYLIVAAVSLALSSALMYLFVTVLGLYNMLGRVFTTFIVTCLNYIMHSQLTFNKKFFKDEK